MVVIGTDGEGMECTKLQTLETFPSNSSMPCLKAVEPFLFLHQTIAIISLLQWSRKQTKQDSCIHICFNVSWVSLEGNFSERMVKRDEMNEMPKGFPFFICFLGTYSGCCHHHLLSLFTFLRIFCLSHKKWALLCFTTTSFVSQTNTCHTTHTILVYVDTPHRKQKGVEANEKGYQKEVNPFPSNGQLNQKKWVNINITISQNQT